MHKKAFTIVLIFVPIASPRKLNHLARIPKTSLVGLKQFVLVQIQELGESCSIHGHQRRACLRILTVGTAGSPRRKLSGGRLLRLAVAAINASLVEGHERHVFK